MPGSSGTDADGFSITSTNIVDRELGTLSYGFSGPSNLPFQGGCRRVAAPTIRTDVVSSGANRMGNGCIGAFRFDYFNADLANGANPALQVVAGRTALRAAVQRAGPAAEGPVARR